MATALVVGNMIGSGIYLLPSSLAALGPVSLLGWVISGAGALLVAFLFARLSRLVKGSGGPYLYPRAGFGEFVGFLSGWGYWVSVLLTNASIALVFAGYLLVFFPSWQGSSLAAASIALAAVWLLTLINANGVRTGGKVQLATTVLKIIPLLLIAVAGLFYFKPEHFAEFNLSGRSNLAALGSAVTLTLFAFLGIESATVPAGNVKQAERNVPLATIAGTIIVIVVYLLLSLAIMGLVPPQSLADSPSPLADAAFRIWGEAGRLTATLGALVSTFGALNGWILIQGQMPMAMARDKLFPHIFDRQSAKGVPLIGLLVSSVIVSVVVLGNQSRGLVEIFSLLILMSTFLNLITYLFSSMAAVMILIREQPPGWRPWLMPTFRAGVPVFLFSLWAVYGSGMTIVFYGFLALMLGLPFYVWGRIKRSEKEENETNGTV